MGMVTAAPPQPGTTLIDTIRVQYSGCVFGYAGVVCSWMSTRVCHGPSVITNVRS